MLNSSGERRSVCASTVNSRDVLSMRPPGESRFWRLSASESQYLSGLYQTRDQYRSNADQAVRLGEFRKASELLWGAVTQQLKAFATTHNILITSHRQFFDFLRQLSGELGDKSIYAEFVELNALHKNFYDEVIPVDLFPDYYEKALHYIGRLVALTSQNQS